MPDAGLRDVVYGRKASPVRLRLGTPSLMLRGMLGWLVLVPPCCLGRLLRLPVLDLLDVAEQPLEALRESALKRLL